MGLGWITRLNEPEQNMSSLALECMGTIFLVIIFNRAREVSPRYRSLTEIVDVYIRECGSSSLYVEFQHVVPPTNIKFKPYISSDSKQTLTRKKFDLIISDYFLFPCFSQS